MSKLFLSPEDVMPIISAFDGKRVMVIGDVMVDRYIYGICERISPEAPVPVVSFKEEKQGLGGAANVALNLKMLGADVMLYGDTGFDDEGDFIERECRRCGINFRHITQSWGGSGTTVKTRVIADRQQVCRIDRDKKPDGDLITFDFSGREAIFVSDYGKGVVSDKLMENVRNSCIPFYCDPKSTDLALYRNAEGITPNKKESDAFRRPYAAGTLAASLVKLGIKSCLVTMGNEGVRHWDLNWDWNLGEDFSRLPGHKRELSDACGAGDTAFAVYGLSKVCGADTSIAAALANLAGSLVCEHPGVVPITRIALVEAIECSE